VRNAFRQEVSKLRSRTPKGVVVSPDPFFRLTAPAFASEMKTGLGNIPICYPFKDFPLSGTDFLLPRGAMLSSGTML
jgi:hypothetical protein